MHLLKTCLSLLLSMSHLVTSPAMDCPVSTRHSQGLSLRMQVAVADHSAAMHNQSVSVSSMKYRQVWQCWSHGAEIEIG